MRRDKQWSARDHALLDHVLHHRIKGYTEKGMDGYRYCIFIPDTKPVIVTAWVRYMSANQYITITYHSMTRASVTLTGKGRALMLYRR